MSEKAPGSQKKSQFTNYDSSETDLKSIHLYHRYRCPPNGPYNSYIHNSHHLSSFPIAQNPETNLPQKRNPEEFLSSIWVPMRHPCIKQPDVPTPEVITYYAPHKSMTLHFPRVPRDGDIFYSQRVDNVLILGSVSRIAPWEHRSLHSSGYAVDKGLYHVHEINAGVLLLKTGDNFLTSRAKNSTFTYYDSDYDMAVHYTTFPKDGDIFYSQQNDNVMTLYVVPTKNSREYHSQHSSLYSRNRSFYLVEKKDGKVSLDRMGDDIFYFNEENRTATFYLPEKDIALHFTRVPRDGDIFCSQRSGNVVVLDILPAEDSQKHPFVYPWDKDLYRVHGGNGGFLLVKMDSNNMPSGESYFIGEKHHDDENTTFTYYIHSSNLAFHFNRVPTHDDIFKSQLKNNIMILEVCGIDAEQYRICTYGSLFDVYYYRVQQIDAGFKLVKIKDRAVLITPEYQCRLRLKIRRYIASSPCPDEEDDLCAVCLVAYNNFDRIGRLSCGHEYHVSCIMRWLHKKNICPYCRGEAVSVQDFKSPKKGLPSVGDSRLLLRSRATETRQR